MEPAVVVAATKGFAIALFVLFACACGVNLSQSSFGAAGRCEPDASEADSFVTSIFLVEMSNRADISQTCETCHKVGGLYSTGYIYPDPATTYSASQKKDVFCTHRRFGRTIIDKVTIGPHTGPSGLSATAKFPLLLQWLDQQGL